MAVLDLAYLGNPILRKKALPITEVTDEIRQLVDDMIETCRAADGIGLAAPQIHRDIRVMLIVPFHHDEDGNAVVEEPIVMINPELTEPAEEMNTHSEGCLSIPGVYGEVTRPVAITVEWMDLNGKMQKQRFTGFSARQIMHENDHLNGVLFVDRIHGKERKLLDPQLAQVKKKYRKAKR